MKRINDRKQRRKLYAILKGLRKQIIFSTAPNETRKELKRALGF